MAGRVQPAFAWEPHRVAVGDICRLLEGLPLGIELAAALVDRVPTANIAGQMRQNMDMLATTMRDVPARHRSLRAVFEQSWQLLSHEEQAVLARLSLFRGGFTLAAAAAVAESSQSILESLQRQSLLRPSTHHRYDLHEVIRQYAAEKLAARTDAASTSQQFARYYSQMLAEQRHSLRRREAVQVLTGLRQDVDNVRAAWQWMADQQQAALIQAAFASLALFYEMSNLYEEGLAALSQGVTAVRQLVKWPEDSWFLELLAAQVHFLNLYARFAEAEAGAATALELAQRHGLEHVTAAVYLRWGQAFLRQGLFAEAEPYLSQALVYAQAERQLSLTAATQLTLSRYYDDRGDLDLARTHLEGSLEIYQELDDIWGQARVLRQLGAMSGFDGHYETAHLYYGEALDYFQQLDDREGQAAIHNNLGSLYMNKGQYALARPHLDRALDLRRQLGAERHAINTYINLGSITGLLGQYDEAEAYLTEGLAIVRALGNRRAEGVILLFLGYVRLCQHQFAAKAIFEEALLITEEIGTLSFAALARFRLGTIEWICGQPEKALPLFIEALRMAREEKFSFLILDVLSDLGLLYQELGRSEAALKTSAEAIATAQDYNRPSALAYALTRQADIWAAQAKWRQAAIAYEEAAQLWVAADQFHLAVEAWGGLAHVAHGENDLVSALTYVALILAEDERQQLQGVLRPFPIYLTCYQVLQQLGDSRARPLLYTTCQRLEQQAGQLLDESQQHAFLTGVSAHQTLLRLFAEDTANSNEP
jgi:tetratricopeptide (TPR) repeat protein